MVRDLLSQAYSAMRYNRRRTALTMLGMAWGIATVVLLLAYGAGFGRAIEIIFANWGTRIIGVFPGRTSQQAGGQKAGTQIKFTIEDLDRITDAAPLVNRITPEVDKQVNVQHDVRTYTLPVQGNYPSIFQILALKLAEGRLLNERRPGARARGSPSSAPTPSSSSSPASTRSGRTSASTASATRWSACSRRTCRKATTASTRPSTSRSAP